MTAESDKQPPTNPLREDLIRPATKFLSDPKVSDSPLAKKVAFLESKGLNSAEIEEAMIRSKSPSSSSSFSVSSNQNTGIPPPLPAVSYQSPQYHYPWSSRVRDFAFIAAIAGSAGYGLYYIAKTYFGDVFFADTCEKKKVQDEMVEKLFQKVTETLEEIRIASDKRESDLQDLKEELQDIKNLIPSNNTFNSQIVATSSSSVSLSEVQNEIRSLKSLLLNRRSFPPVPNSNSTIANNNNSISNDPMGLMGITQTIPSWQLQHQTKSPHEYQQQNNLLSDTEQEADQEDTPGKEDKENIMIDPALEEINAPMEKSIDINPDAISADLFQQK